MVRMYSALILCTWILGLCQGQGRITGGILQYNTNQSVIILSDSAIITILYDTREIQYYWNNFIEKGETVSESVERNVCVENILNEARSSRFKIKQYLIHINLMLQNAKQYWESLEA